MRYLSKLMERENVKTEKAKVEVTSKTSGGNQCLYVYIYICAPCKIKNNCPFGLLMVDSFMLWLHSM